MVSLKADLKDFYQQHYVADNMTLVVLTDQSMEAMQSWVEEKFSEVPSASYQPKRIDEPLFEEGVLPLLLKVQPEKDVRELSLMFPMPDHAEHYKTKPLSIIGHVLGHEGKGSLLSYLKQQGWG